MNECVGRVFLQKGDSRRIARLESSVAIGLARLGY